MATRSASGLTPRGSAEHRAAVDAVSARFADRSSRAAAALVQHASTLTWIESSPPDLIVWPESVADVVAIVELARVHRLAIVPYGAGTSLEGHINAPFGGVSLDMSRMNHVLAVNGDDLDCVVEPGVTQHQLETHLRDTGLFFPVDPGAGDATLGGMAATRASGTRTVRYGSMRDNVMSVTAVLADGSVVRTAQRARKSAAGYDLTRLLVGSEGTLGIFVELTLKLQPRPEAVLAAVARFATIGSAANAAIAAIQGGCQVSRLELLDEASLAIAHANGLDPVPAPPGPALFVEVEGTPNSAAEHMALFETMAREAGAKAVLRAATADERNRLWASRHDAFWSIRAAFPGRAYIVTDVAVPISRLAECLKETSADIATSRLVAPILGHVGDGNFHAVAAVDPSDAGEMVRLNGFLDRLARRAIAMSGTCTGEHGIGEGKARYLALEHGAGVDAMRAIKTALDPLGILNPGKLFSDS